MRPISSDTWWNVNFENDIAVKQYIKVLVRHKASVKEKFPQSTSIRLKSTMETPAQCVKYVQS